MLLLLPLDLGSFFLLMLPDGFLMLLLLGLGVLSQLSL